MEEFYAKVKSYLRNAGYSLEAISGELGMPRSVLSAKFSGTRKAPTYPELKIIIKTLAKLEAISTRAQALELLDLVECPKFSETEWELPPLNKLEKTTKPVSLSPILPTPLTPKNQSPQIELKPFTVLNEVYRLERLLGKGGMGQVWLATHLMLDEPRAIKFVLTPQLQSRFIMGEAKNALRLIHPNIVRVYELSHHQTSPFIVMEYIDGSDLKVRLRSQGFFQPEEVARLLTQLASALSQVHSLGLVHRDIKSANVLLTADGQVKLTDFGIVKDTSSNLLDMTDSNYGLGTPLYMAPEQVRGETSPLSDQYALGVLLYELLTGRVPFTGNQAAVLIQHATVLPTSPSETNPAIPPSLSWVVLKALAKDPLERFASVLELAAAFAQADITPASSTSVNLSTQLLSPVAATKIIPHNLPQMLEPLLGRQQEIAEITARLQEPANRLVTLTGPGGTGKTRLALAVAEALLYSPVQPAAALLEGIYFVPVENITERNTFVSTLVQTLQIKEVPGKELLSLLKEFLSERRLLLILDNFEQLVAQGATVLPELLRAAPNLKLLVTSRELLNLSQESDYKVSPLTLPVLGKVAATPNSLLEYAAIALFQRRAQAVKPDFKLTEENLLSVVEICQRLDGLPLAIELAAARSKMLPPAKLLERLSLKLLSGGARDLPARQQTLRGAIDWSYNLLEEGEKPLFQRLAVFAGDFDLDAAEAVCTNDQILQWDVLDGLEALVNKSLIKQLENEQGDIRYTMLQTIREYAQEQLAVTGEQTFVTEQYIRYFLALVEKFEPALETSQQLITLQRWDSEYANLQDVLYITLERGLTEEALRLASVMGPYWINRGYWSEGRTYLSRALALPGASAYRATALNQAASLAYQQADYEAARRYAEESLLLGRQLDDKAAIAEALLQLGNALTLVDLAACLQYGAESLALYKQLTNKVGIANALNHLGKWSTANGESQVAQRYYEESLALRRASGNKLAIANTLSNMGALAGNVGDTVLARRYFEESLSLRRELGNRMGLIISLHNLSLLAFNMKDYAVSASYAQESLILCQELGAKLELVAILFILGQLAHKQKDYPKARRLLTECGTMAQAIGNKLKLGTSRNDLGLIAIEQADYANAKIYLEEARQVFQEIDNKGDLATVLNNLGAVAFYSGDYALARQYYDESLALRIKLDHKFITYSWQNLGNLANHLANYDQAHDYYLKILEYSGDNGDHLVLANALAGLTYSLIQQATVANYLNKAANLIGKTYALLSQDNAALEKTESEFFEQAIAAARTGLGATEFADSFSRGQTLSVAECLF